MRKPALQLELDGINRVAEARNKQIGIEQLSEAELKTLEEELDSGVKSEEVADDRSHAADPTREQKHQGPEAER
jgi:low affinity Fe/Cu permease